MAIQWADNFLNYGDDANFLLDGLYVQIGNDFNGSGQVVIVDDPDPNANPGSRALRFPAPRGSLGGSFHTRFRFAFPNGSLISSGCAFRLWIDGLPTLSDRSFRWHVKDVSNNIQFTIRVETTGQLVAQRADGSEIGRSAIPVITANAFNHIEFKYTIDNTIGELEVRVNGIPISGLVLTGVDTQSQTSADASQIEFTVTASDGAGGGVSFIKDLIFWDTTGSENTDFLGSVEVITLRTTSDDTLNWTPSAGTTGFDLIDETDPDDLDFIEADNTPPAASVFNLEDLPPDITSIRALIPVVRVQKTDGGDGQIQTGIIVNADTDLGADRPVTPVFTYWYDVSEVSPETGFSYTPTEVNNAKFQIDRTV